jgi:PKD repeat protein
MKKSFTSIIKKSLNFYGKALLTVALFFSLGLATLKAQSPYCTPYYTYQYGNCTQYNYNMSINALEILAGSTKLYSRAHTTTYGGCNASSGDYFLMSSSSMFTLKGGSTYQFGFTTGQNYNVNMIIWIDLNKDNDFDDANERLTVPTCNGSTGNVNAGTSVLKYFDVAIPVGGTPGTTRMRIRSVYYGMGCLSNDNSCQDRGYGECEDYTITYASYTDDVATTKITPPVCSFDLKATVTNVGTNDVTGGVNVGWSVNGAFQTANRITSTISKQGGTSTITLAPNFTFVDGTTYKVKVFTYTPNGTTDTDKSDDTANLTFKFVGPAGTPTTYDGIKCGPGKAPLKCTTPYNTDSVNWFNAATGGSIVAKGKNTLSPSLFLGVNKFWAQAVKMSATNNISNGLNYYTYFTGGGVRGGMFDLVPKTDFALDSFTVRLQTSATNPTFNVYYKTGSYNGSQSNASAWTKIANDKVAKTSYVGGAWYATINISEVSLVNGTTYGFYVTTTSTSPSNPLVNNYIGSGQATASNADLNMVHGSFFYNTEFGGYYNFYNMGVRAHYRLQFCPSTRVPVTITVNPSPNGAGFTKGTPFQTTQPNTLGTLSSPDIVASGDQLTYDLTPPTGYTNSGYGTTWETFTPVIKTKLGTNIPSGSIWSYAAPSGSNPGKLTFKPDATLPDSFLIVTMMIKDKGPYFCDSTITRHIFVAPRPVPDFEFNSPICDGDAVLFNDKSKVSSGGLSYKWDFNTGNPADTSTINTTVFKFPTFGSYDVNLTTTTIPYGYKETKTYTVVVTEIPKIDFKVLNACEKVAVSFTNNTTISAGTVTYAWDFGDPSTTLDKSTQKSPKYTYTNAGAYKVTLRASASGCTSELSKNANQFAVPVAKYNIPSLLCDNSDVQFTNASTIKMGNMGYTWDFGDGGISNFANPIHQFATGTAKTVKMVAVSEFGCKDSTTKTFTLLQAPIAEFTWGAACNLTNTSFTFTGSKPAGALTTFNWNFAGEGSTTLENPSKLFSVTGRKNVTLTLVSNNGCASTKTKEVNVKLQSKADFNSGDICEDDDAVFTNKSIVSQGNLQYNWKFGDATTSKLQSPRHRYTIGTSSQTFNVTLVAIVPGGCSDSISKQISVNKKPVSDFTYTTSGRQVTFKSNQAGNTLYQWRFGDGGNSTSANTVYNYLDFGSGKYQACLAVINADKCFSETCKLVQISSGVDKLTKLSGVKVYPNPNKGNFTVTVEDPKSDIAIGVYNLLGEVVKTIETNSLKSTYSVDLNVANGVYLVKVTNGGLTSTQKVTINK